MVASIVADTVCAIAPAMDSDPGNSKIAFDRTDACKGGTCRHEELAFVPQGEAVLTNMRGILKAEYKRVGNLHCGR